MGLQLKFRQKLLATVVLLAAYAPPMELFRRAYDQEPENVLILQQKLTEDQKIRIAKGIAEEFEKTGVVLTKEVKQVIRCIVESARFDPAQLGFILKIIKLSKKQPENVLRLVMRVLEDEPLEKFEERYEEGGRLANSLGADSQNSIVVLNFIRGLLQIGEQRVLELNAQLGIENFARYSKRMLIDLCESLSSRQGNTKPIGLVVFNKNDWNGAFYNEGRKLDQLVGYYRLLIVETNADEDYKNRVKWTGTEYGNVSLIVLGGHGTKKSVQLGDLGDGEKATVDTEDIKNGKFSGMECYLTEGAIIVFDACDTGADDDSIAAEYSKSTGLMAFAPAVHANIQKYVIGDDKKIKGVEYTVSSSAFTGDGTPLIERCITTSP